MNFDDIQDVSQLPPEAEKQQQSEVKAPLQPFDQPTVMFDDIQDQTPDYSSAGQTLKAGIEGIAQGVAGPLATLFETKTLGISLEDIKARAEASPIAHGLGEVAGITGSLLSGTGIGGLMAKTGEMALQGGSAGAKVAEATNLAMKAAEAAKTGLPEAAQLAEAAQTAAKGLSYGHKVGSAVVQQAAEMAVLGSSDEVSKMILQEPGASAEQAIANIGLAAAIGGAGGAFFAGAVNPLWKATAGPKVEAFFNAVKNKTNGAAPLALDSEIEADLARLNVQPTPIQRADISSDSKSTQFIKDLSRAENEAMLNEKSDLQSKVANSVMEPLGTNLDQMLVYDNATEGRALKSKVTEHLKEKFVPLWEAMDKRNEEAALISVVDEARLALRDRLIEKGITESAGNEKILNAYIEAGDQALNHETIAGFDKMDTQLRRSAKHFAADPNITQAQRDIRNTIKDFKESVINKVARESEKSGIKGAEQAGEQLVAERAALNKTYAQAEAFREELGDHFNITRPDSARQFMNAIENDVTPEQVMKKFSIKENMEGAQFLQKNMPEVFQHVVENERRAILKPAIIAAAKKGDLPIDINKLNDIIIRAKGGKDTYLNTILPAEFIQRAEAAGRIMQATTKAKDSGTPAGLYGVLKGIGTSALASVGWMTGHGAAQSLFLAEIIAQVGKIAPEQAKLAYLTFMGSNQPVKSEGIKAMADFFHSIYQGEHLLNKAVTGVFKPGAQVLTTNAMPNDTDRAKLDKQLDKIEADPSLMRSQNDAVGHYLPGHQMELTKTTASATQYLLALKPHPQKSGPLDKEIEPSSTQMARYNRALDIAQQPAIVMQHIKDGTLQTTDIQDLQNMYPGLYKNMVQKIAHQIVEIDNKGEQLPYKTKVGISLFLGQPMDTSMLPASIMAAQPKPKLPPAPQGVPKPKSLNSLGKSNKSYQTPNQGAELDKASRD